MKNKKWKEFEKLTDKCYSEMIQDKGNRECWHKAFGILKEIIADEKEKDPKFGNELYQLDEITDYEYDVQGWLEDYIDDMDMRGEYEKLLEVCGELLNLFAWKEDSPSDIKFMKASALGSLGRKEDAAAFCRQWLEEEADNVVAVAANIYADMAIRDLETAGELVRKHIQEETRCTEENDVLFTAASAYYKMAGDKKEKERIDRELEAYEEYLKEYFMEDGDDDVFGWDDDCLPFN